MKTSGIVAVVVFASSVVMAAEDVHKVSGFIETQIKMSEGQSSQVVPTVGLSGKIAGKFGWSLFTLQSQGWSEVYAGPTFAPASWCQIGAAIGIETGSTSPRYGSSLWLGKGRFSTLAIYEKGELAAWYKTVTLVKVADHVKVGVQSQTGLGVGPRVDVSYKQLTVYLTSLHEGSEHTEILGLKFSF